MIFSILKRTKKIRYFPEGLPDQLRLLLSSSSKAYDVRSGEFLGEVPYIEGWELVCCGFPNDDATVLEVRFTSPAGGDITLFGIASDYEEDPGTPYKAGPGYSALVDYLSVLVLETIGPQDLDHQGRLRL